MTEHGGTTRARADRISCRARSPATCGRSPPLDSPWIRCCPFERPFKAFFAEIESKFRRDRDSPEWPRPHRRTVPVTPAAPPQGRLIMAKLIYSAITSLDGCVADEEGNFD